MQLSKVAWVLPHHPAQQTVERKLQLDLQQISQLLGEVAYEFNI